MFEYFVNTIVETPITTVDGILEAFGRLSRPDLLPPSSR